MSTFLLAWNPNKWEWKSRELAAKILEAHSTGRADDRWSCGNRRELPVGSRFFLIRLGQAPRGLVGSGVTTSEPALGPHWDATQTKSALYVGIRFDFLSREPLVSWAELKQGPFAPFHWGIQASGITLPDSVATALELVWSRRKAGDDPVLPDEVSIGPAFPEGARKKVAVNAYERNPQARAACLVHFGYKCSVCDVLLEDRYGEIAAGFIHVHHTVPLAGMPPNYQVSPKKDMRPVCPNCHAILHRRVPPLAVHAARRLVRRGSERVG